MKTKLFFILFALASLVGLSACSDDDKDPDYAKEIKGEYKGDVALAGATVAENVTIEMDYKSENKVILKMDQQILTMKINIACDSNVTFKDGKYIISGSTKYPIEGTNETMDVTVNGTIDNSGKAQIDIQAGIFSVVYTGVRQ